MNEKATRQPAHIAATDLTDGRARGPMAGADPRLRQPLGNAAAGRWHNLIVSNTAIGLGSRMHGHKNEIYIGKMRVMLPGNVLCLPDLVIAGGEPVFADVGGDVLLNPTLLVDIFSAGSDSLERSRKLESFLEMESIKECLLVKQEEMRVEHYARQNQRQWIYRIYNQRDDVISLDSVNCKLSLQEIYAGVRGRTPEAARAYNRSG